MAKYKLTKKAIADLNQIWNYTIEKWSEEQAELCYKMLIDNCQDIANYPNLGKGYEGIINDLFGLKANRHIIFYLKLQGDPIEITRILHEKMDLSNRIIE